MCYMRVFCTFKSNKEVYVKSIRLIITEVHQWLGILKKGWNYLADFYWRNQQTKKLKAAYKLEKEEIQQLK